MKLLKYLLLTACCTALVACGFQMRGSADLPESIQTIYIQGINPRNDFGLELRTALTRNGVRVLTEYEEGAALLTVLENNLERRVLSVNPVTAKVSEYELTLEVRFDLTDGQQNRLLQNEYFELQRDYLFDADQVLGREAEERLLLDEMYKQLSQTIIRRLSALDN